MDSLVTPTTPADGPGTSCATSETSPTARSNSTYETNEWRMIHEPVPKDTAKKWSLLLSIARLTNLGESNRRTSVESERIDAVESIIAEAFNSIVPRFLRFCGEVEEWGEYGLACFDVWTRDDFVCLMCGSTGATTGGLWCHHIVPRGNGGPLTDTDNIATVCQRCHIKCHEGWRKVARELFTKAGTPAEKADRLLAAAR
jgi:5-methylcytosine-specific restriction endonuclease McrA